MYYPTPSEVNRSWLRGSGTVFLELRFLVLALISVHQLTQSSWQFLPASHQACCHVGWVCGEVATGGLGKGGSAV